ncbi:toxin TumE [Alkalinema pantanalense]|uniref:toxin TumE n=1 Tax=Alkalinema pantanalense TaxID=1620705 RepID=UPI003D6F8EFE
MPHELIAAYLSEIEQAILAYPNLDVDRYIEEILTLDRANLRIRLRTSQNYLLEINEAIVIIDNQVTTLDYRYQYQDHQSQLIFRYNNTPISQISQLFLTISIAPKMSLLPKSPLFKRFCKKPCPTSNSYSPSVTPISPSPTGQALPIVHPPLGQSGEGVLGG